MTHPGFVTAKLSYSRCPKDDYYSSDRTTTTTVGDVDAALPLHNQKGFKQVINIFENILQLGKIGWNFHDRTSGQIYGRLLFSMPGRLIRL